MEKSNETMESIIVTSIEELLKRISDNMDFQNIKEHPDFLADKFLSAITDELKNVLEFFVEQKMSEENKNAYFKSVIVSLNNAHSISNLFISHLTSVQASSRFISKYKGAISNAIG